MSYFITVTDTVRDHFLDEANLRYLRVVIDPDGTPATYTPRDISCDASEDYQKWSFTVKNRTGLSVGLHANMAATVDVSHNGSTWLTVFTGFVSDDGFNRRRGLVTDDYLSLDLVDATKRKGTKRKPTPVLLSSFTASDPSAESSSVLHYLANQMGVTVEAAEIDHTIDLIELGKSTVWAELQALRDAYHADMYFRYDGKLLFHSPFDTGYSAPSSEWTFQGDPAEAVSGDACRIYGVVSEAYVPVRCNYAKTSFDDYNLLSERIIYKNTEAYNESSGLITITLTAGAYWPGPAATDVARLEYKDPESGADYPFAIDIVTPTLGAVGAGKDIESTGGSLEIVSVNGSTTATSAEGGATQIILYNNSAEPCTIRRLTVRGKPYQLKEQVKVEHVDAAVTDAVDYVEQEVNGRYAASASQIFDTLYHMVEEGKGRPRQFAFGAPFMPWIQRRAIVTVQMPGESAVRCRIDSYAHRNRGKTMQGMHTTLVCTELGTHTPTGSPYVETTPAIPAWQAKLTSIAPNAGATYRSASTSAPVTPFLGDLWYQTDTQLMKRYDGSAWQNVGTSPFDESEDTGVSFETPSKKVQILDDGTIKAVDGEFSGTVNASAGSFAGTISTNELIVNSSYYVAGDTAFKVTAYTDDTYPNTEVKSYTLNAIASGTVRFKVTVKAYISGSNHAYPVVTIKVNGATVYSSGNITSTSWTTVSQDVTYAGGDIVLAQVTTSYVGVYSVASKDGNEGYFYNKTFNASDVLAILQKERITITT